MLESFRNALQVELESLVALTPRIGVALVVFTLVYLVGRGIAVGVERLLARGGRTNSYQLLVRRIVGWGFALLGVVGGLQVLGLTALASSLLATGGIAAIVLGFAFKEVGENLLAGLFLAFGRSFDVGDVIESGGLRGVVQEVDLRHTHIRTPDGCDIFIPSAAIFRNPLHNFTRDGLRRGSFKVGLDYRDDPDEAREVIRTAVAVLTEVLAEPAPSVEVAGFTASYQELEVFFWIDTTSGSALSRARTRAMAAARAALLREGFTFSSDVVTAVDLAPVQVRMDETAG